MIPDQRDVENLVKVVEKEGITFWNSVPAIMDMMLENVSDDYHNESLRLVLLSGDWIPLKLPEKIKPALRQAGSDQSGRGHQTSIWSIYHPVTEVKESWKSIPYGRPLANQGFYVLNYERQLCPVGVPGELYISGVGLAQGYLNDEAKTGEAFLKTPEFGNLYKTGDYGVLHPEGHIEFLGRKNQQVKIRGYRIELGDIESRLLAYGAVRNAVVIDRTDAHGKKYLCAYLVTEQAVDTQELRPIWRSDCRTI